MVLTDKQRMAHLLRRAGFGASPSELASYLDLGWNGALDRLLNYDQVDDSAVDGQAQQMEQVVLANWDQSKSKQPPLGGYQLIWLYRMLNTARPLQEKMTLFWHAHFATANYKVNNPPAMATQNQLFRDHALGNYHDLVLGVAKDPAMLRWLDSNSNRKAQPNENFARELMEVFTLGVGNYTEDDVREGARAFTGWFFKPNQGYVFNKNQHDAGSKTFLGQTGNWNGDDIINIIFQQPALATFIVTKLYNYFVHDHPDASTISALAASFQQHNFDLRSLVSAILHLPDFTSDDAYHGVVRSPVEWFVSTLNNLGVQDPTQSAQAGQVLLGSLRRMGMEIYNPPNVGGWDWGAGWISSATLLERFAAANTLTSNRGKNQQYGLDPVAFLASTSAQTPTDVVDGLLDLLVDGDVSSDTRGSLVDYATNGYGGDPSAFTADATRSDRAIRGTAQMIMSTPVYQMA